MRRNGATCGAAATATPSRDAQATTSQSAHGHNRSRSTGKMHGLFFHRLTAFKPALFLAQGVARRADLFWFRDDVVSRCCMARVVAFDLSLCCAAFGHCVLRGLMLIVCVRHSSRGESRAVVTTERPPLQDCRAVSRVTQNSTLHQHEYATHETPRRRPHRQPIQLGGHYSPASGARPGPSSPLAAPASARRLSPYRQARLAQLHEMAAAFGFVEKGLEARTHVSSPSPHLTLLRLIAAVVTPLLDDPSPGSVRPEDRDPSLGAVSDRSRPPALDPDLDHIGVASPRPEATTGNATTTTNTTTDSTTTTTTTGPARKKHSQCGRQFGQRWPLDSWLPRARGDGPARRRDRGWRAPP